MDAVEMSLRGGQVAGQVVALPCAAALLLVLVHGWLLYFCADLMKIEGAVFGRGIAIALVGGLSAAFVQRVAMPMLHMEGGLAEMARWCVATAVMAGMMMVLFDAKFQRSLAAVVMATAILWVLTTVLALFFAIGIAGSAAAS